MIIKREYVSFRALINTDVEAKVIIQKVFDTSYNDHPDKESVINSLLDHCLFEREMGWCMRGIGEMLEKFEQLDLTNPYDNNLTYDDVNDVDIIWKDENSIVLHLIHRTFDEGTEYRQIVQRKELESETEG